MPARMTEPEAVRRFIKTEYYPEDSPTPLALLEFYAFASVVPGICMARDCGAITDRCEPDAIGNWCHECRRQTVHNLPDLIMWAGT